MNILLVDAFLVDSIMPSLLYSERTFTHDLAA